MIPKLNEENSSFLERNQSPYIKRGGNGDDTQRS